MERKERSIMHGRVACTLLTFLFMTMLSRISALSVTVKDVECVYEYVFYEGDTVSGNFIAVDHDVFWKSDHPGIDFTVTSSGGNTVHSLKGTSGDKFEFKAPSSGMFKFCFHNPHSTPETVSFHIHVGHIPNEHNLAKDEHLDPINVKIAELAEALESVTAEQKYLKLREARHRHSRNLVQFAKTDGYSSKTKKKTSTGQDTTANESTSMRVICYTVGEYILLALVSGLQVVYIRRLFGKSVAYNRV